ncbi:unnamed protein product [Pedinophyceae sp. YPF-701]|nr:unnamed protein product [Pedinophyceae sp. YPF-701]
MRSALLLLLALAVMATGAQASHFRHGKIKYEVTGGTTTVTVDHAWRDGATNYPRLYGCGVSNMGANSNTFVGEFADAGGLKYDVTQSTYIINTPSSACEIHFRSCCRIGGLESGSNAYFRVAATIDPSEPNGMTFGGQAIQPIPIGATATTFFPLASPPSGGFVCRKATNSEQGFTHEPFGNSFTVSTAAGGCVLQGNTVGKQNKKFAYQIVAEEVGGPQKTAVDVIVEVNPASAIPAPVVTGSASVTCTPGTACTQVCLTGTIPGTYAPGWDLLVTAAAPLPVAGMTLTPLSSTTGTLTPCFDWTPGLSDAGTSYAITVVFRNSAGASAAGSISIIVRNDLCPNDPNKNAPGVCGCGVADTDSDGDGTEDCNDQCPADAGKVAPGVCGCGVADTDSDGDGTEDCNDQCPNDPNKIAPGVCGCGVADTDSDGDGTCNCNDQCPNDPNKIAPGVCGCGVADTDSDGDGTEDCNDQCPADAGKIAPGVCGCGVADTDSDGDGTEDCNDQCPADAGKMRRVAPGVCGCGVADTDSDGDGTEDCNDQCPADAGKIAPGVCGCGVPDSDDDGDGLLLCLDNCLGTAADEVVFPAGPNAGCSAFDLCPCAPAEPWKNHGKYVTCVVFHVHDLINDGIINEQEGDDIISTAAQTDCGKGNNGNGNGNNGKGKGNGKGKLSMSRKLGA